MKMKHGSRLMMFIISFIVWVLLTWKVDLATIVLGIVVSVISSLLFGDILSGSLEHALHPIRYLWFLYFVPLFLWEMVKANVDVAWRVIHPRLPINPGLIKIKTRLKSDVGLTMLGCSLTLTPGNTTVDIKGDEIYIHCIDVESKTKEKVEKFEKIIARIFE